MRDFVGEALTELYQMVKNDEKELKNLPKGTIIVKKKKLDEYSYFKLISSRKKGKNLQKRQSLTKKEDEIAQLARCRYLEQELKMAKANIEMLKKLDKQEIAMTPENIIGKLTKAYKTLKSEYFFPNKAEAIRWAAQPYRMNPKNPEGRKIQSPAGYKVRSKSELYISRELMNHRLPHRYEGLLEDIGVPIAGSPDFMIKRPSDGKLFYWEHCGMVNDEDYMKRHVKKLQEYEQYGIVEWRNLIVTYDDEFGNLDTDMVGAYIEGRLLK